MGALERGLEGTYDLVGPKEYTFRELLLLVMEVLERRKPFLSLPLWLMDRLAPLLSPLPFSPLTRDQYLMLKEGNTAPFPEALKALLPQPWPWRRCFRLSSVPVERAKQGAPEGPLASSCEGLKGEVFHVPALRLLVLLLGSILSEWASKRRSFFPGAISTSVGSPVFNLRLNSTVHLPPS